MAELPNLAGVATKDLVDKIGTGRYSASYISWSRTINLLHQHAPGWMVDYEAAPDGGMIHRAPVGGYLMIRFRHIDGTVTPALPQAIKDHKHNPIAYEKIGARDVTDTQRRGMCMAAAMVFGLGYELWANDPMEDSYSRPAPDSAPDSAPKPPTAQAAPKAAPAAATGGTSEVTETTFREAALEKGVHTVAIDALVAIVKGDKLNGDFGKGLEVLGSKSWEELNSKYGPKEEETSSEQW